MDNDFSKIEIRQYSPEFLPEVLRIEYASFAIDAYSAEKFQYLFKQQPECFLLAFADGTVAAYAAGFMKDDAGYIDSMATAPEFRGRSIGRKLLSELERKFEQLGAKRLTLHVRMDNQTALRLYEQFGFHISSIVESYYSDGASAYLMSKEL